MNHDHDTSPEDFAPIERQLRDQRPSPSGAELDRVRHRAMTAQSDHKRSRGGVFSPARLALVSLVSGLLLVGGSGASLAVSGLSGDGSAGKAQYIQTPSTTTTPETGAVLPSQEQGGDPDQTEEDGVAPSLDQGETAPAAAGEDPAQETRQAENGGSDGRLPFTGLLALPLMLIGVIMLAAGFVLRRSAGRTTA